MSGGLLEARAGGTLVVKASFCSGSTWIVTFGWAVWNAVAACCQTVLSCPAVAFVHQVRVTFPLLELGVLLPPLLPQAARASAAAAAMVTAAGFPRLRMLLLS